jgi:hypothetical protein
MDNLNLITLKTFSDRLQAEMAKGLLDNAGIPSILNGGDAGASRPTPFAYTPGVSLSVREDHLEKAKEILSVMDNE